MVSLFVLFESNPIPFSTNGSLGVLISDGSQTGTSVGCGAEIENDLRREGLVTDLAAEEGFQKGFSVDFREVDGLVVSSSTARTLGSTFSILIFDTENLLFTGLDNDFLCPGGRGRSEKIPKSKVGNGPDAVDPVLTTRCTLVGRVATSLFTRGENIAVNIPAFSVVALRAGLVFGLDAVLDGALEAVPASVPEPDPVLESVLELVSDLALASVVGGSGKSIIVSGVNGLIMSSISGCRCSPR